jgi:hypothetical protein
MDEDIGLGRLEVGGRELRREDSENLGFLSYERVVAWKVIPVYEV